MRPMNDDLRCPPWPRPLPPPKGGEYEVLAVARHSETLEAQVVYRPLYKQSGWWVRPHAMFIETVTVDGREQPRFAAL